MIVAGGLGRSFAFGRGVAQGPQCDPYYPYVSLLLHMDGVNGSTTFTDNSPVTKTVTANGGAQVNTSIVKYGTGSGYFDGNSGSYLSAPSSADFTLGSDNFTVEGWFNPGAWGGTNRALISRRTSGWTAGAWTIWVNMGANSFNIYSYEYDPTGYIPLLNNGSTLILPNVWQHFAWVRNGNVFTLYLDGIQVSTNTSSITIANNSQPLLVGAEDSLFAAPFSGYIDDLRITKGVARYTGNFTPPAAAFPNIDCSSSFSIPAGITVPETFSGLDTYILPTPAVVPETFTGLDTYILPTPAVVPETFSGLDTYILPTPAVVPATLVGPTATDPYFSLVTLLLHMDGSNGSTAFVDSSLVTKTVTSDDTTITTSNVKFGTGSGLIGNTSPTASLAVLASSVVNVTTNDFTIEGWVYLPSSYFNLVILFDKPYSLGFTRRGAPYNDFAVQISAPFGAGSAAGGPNIIPGAWNHWAYVRNGGNWKAYFGGVEFSPVTSTSSPTYSVPTPVGNFTVGGAAADVVIDEVRITNGLARYTSNFTPPTEPFPNS